MKPYYEDGGATIYHGDCREVLAEFAWDVLVTDPPYGMRWKSSRGGVRGACKVEGDDDTGLRDWIISLCGDRPWAVFGTWKIPPPIGCRGMLAWDKGACVGAGDLSFPWKPSWEQIAVGGSGWSGHRGSGVLRHNAVSPNFHSLRKHPTEKPVSLMVEILKKAPPGVVIDPFAGCGSTLLACRLLGVECVGVEIEEKYCEVVARRLSQGVFNFDFAAVE